MNLIRQLQKRGFDFIKIKASVLAFNEYMDLLYGDKVIIRFENRITITFSSGPIYAAQEQLRGLISLIGGDDWACLFHKKKNYGFVFYHNSYASIEEALNSFVGEYKKYRTAIKRGGLKIHDDVTNELLDFDAASCYSDRRSFSDLPYKLIPNTPEEDFIQKEDDIEVLTNLQSKIALGEIAEAELTPEQADSVERLYDQQLCFLDIEKATAIIQSFIFLSITAEQMRRSGWKVY